MRKIHILKAIVDFMWIVTMPIVPLLLLFIPFLFFYDDLGTVNIKISNITLTSISLLGKVLLSSMMLSYTLLIYSLYLFRKTLRCFLQLKIFDNYIIKTYQKIGVLLSIWGITTLIISFISKIYFQQKMTLSIGMNEHLIILCLGLFFMILSEVFKIAKNTKQENDLTI